MVLRNEHVPAPAGPGGQKPYPFSAVVVTGRREGARAGNTPVVDVAGLQFWLNQFLAEPVAVPTLVVQANFRVLNTVSCIL